MQASGGVDGTLYALRRTELGCAVLHPVRQHASFPCPELTKHVYFTSPYQAIVARDISILSSIVFIFDAFTLINS